MPVRFCGCPQVIVWHPRLVLLACQLYIMSHSTMYKDYRYCYYKDTAVLMRPLIAVREVLMVSDAMWR